MEVLEQTVPTGRQERRVVIPSSVLAAISQLPAPEQEGVQRTIGILQQEGLSTQAIDVEALNVPHVGKAFVLRAAGSTDIRLYVHLTDDITIQVDDIVRDRTVRNLFHAS